MNFKIIDLNPDEPQVLLYRDRLEVNDNLTDCVIIQTYGQTEEASDALDWARVEFPDEFMAQSYIKDYSEESARAFLKDMGVVKQHNAWKE